MSTTNVMSVSSQAAAPAKVPDSKAGSRTGKKTNAADDSFDEALGKANTDSKQAAGDVSADTKGSTDDKDSKDENPKNPLAAILAALQQGNGKNEGSKTELAQPQLAGEPATVLAISDTAKGQFVNTAQAAAAVQSNLQTLIPQAAADGVKSQDFLAMLSGQQLKGAKQQGQVPLLQGNLLEAAVPAAQTMQAPLTNDQKGTVVQQAAGTVLEAQLVNTQTAGSQNPPQSGLTTGTPVVQPKMESVAGGTAVPPQSGLVAGAPAAQAPAAQALAVQAPVAQQAPAAQALAVQAPAGADLVAQAAGSTNLPQTAQAPAAAKLSEGPVSVKDLLDGAPLAIEDKTQTAPLHIEGQKSMNQPGSQSQQNGQGEAQHQTLLSGDGIKLAQQLPEEAAADRAPVSKTPDNAQNSSVSMFQQGLQDSIRGTAANHLQSSQPQPAQNDYNIPRQIVDQARLIRTNENTEMVIKLNPEHLGELTLKVSVSQNGSVNASFHSENAQVRTAIENSLVQLRQELNNQGLKVDSVEVYAGLADGQLPQDQGQQAWQNNQQGGTAKIRNVQLGADEYAEDTEVLSAVLQSKENTAMEGVDYRI
mgnify:FL=1